MDYLNWVENNWGILGAMQGHTALYRADRRADRPSVSRRAADAVARPRGREERHEADEPARVRARRGDLVLVASKGGYPKNPGWFYNLKAHPDTEVQVGSEHRRVHARVADAEERKRLWPMALKVYGGYADYQKRTEREIPLVILEPR